MQELRGYHMWDEELIIPPLLVVTEVSDENCILRNVDQLAKTQRGTSVDGFLRFFLVQHSSSGSFGYGNSHTLMAVATWIVWLTMQKERGEVEAKAK